MALVRISSKSAITGAALAAVLTAAFLFLIPSSISVLSLAWLMVLVNKVEIASIVGLGLVALALRRWSNGFAPALATLGVVGLALLFGGLHIWDAYQTFVPEPHRAWWWEAMSSTMAFAEAPFFISLSLLLVFALNWSDQSHSSV